MTEWHAATEKIEKSELLTIQSESILDNCQYDS